MTQTVRLAAIDIGTVTTRLMVADVSDGEIREVERSTDITHLGEGLADSGSLSSDAMQRVEQVIAGYAARIEQLQVQHVTAVATSASRDAENADEFLAMLRRHGVAPQVIAGSREAELSFAGATFRHPGEGLLVVDSGGGSTELVFGDVVLEDGITTARIESARSIDVGSRRLTEMFFRSDPPSRDELDRARAWTAEQLRGFFALLDRRPSEVIGLAGTATTLASIRLEMAEYDSAVVHGYRVSGTDVSDILDQLASIPLEKRRQLVGLHPDRAGVIVAGVLILETVLALAGVEALTVSEHDILYGILLDAYCDLREQG